MSDRTSVPFPPRVAARSISDVRVQQAANSPDARSRPMPTGRAPDIAHLNYIGSPVTAASTPGRPVDRGSPPPLTTSSQPQPVPVFVPAPPASGVPRTSTYGRPLDVHSDVQQTSMVTAVQVAQVVPTGGTAITSASISGRPMDVQPAPIQSAVAADRTPSQKRSRKPKKKTDLDERGRFRHTVRLDPKSEQKLRAVAEILGVDLNAAISVCISVHYHRLTKSGGSEV